MELVLHTCARTAPDVRREKHNGHERLIILSKRCCANLNTGETFKKPDFVHNAPLREKRSGFNSPVRMKKAAFVDLRVFTQWPLKDLVYSSQEKTFHLTRASSHRYLRRQDFSRLPHPKNVLPEKKKFKAYTFGYFQMGIAEVQTEKGGLYLFTATDRTSKFAFARLDAKAARPQQNFFGMPF